MPERWIPLREFLEKSFPIYDTPAGLTRYVGLVQRQRKEISWKNLPTEIKDNFLFLLLLHASTSLPTRRTSSKRMRAKHGPVEIMQKLVSMVRTSPWSHTKCGHLRSDSASLATTQVSTDSLGLPLMARSARGIPSPGKFFAMTAPNGVPINHITLILAEKYRLHPSLSGVEPIFHSSTECPKHGDRNGLSALPSILLKVTVGGFQKYWRNGPTHETLNQLPRLKCVYFTLPEAGGRLENDQRGQTCSTKTSPVPARSIDSSTRKRLMFLLIEA